MYKVCKTEKSIERQKLFQTTLLGMMEKQKFQDITVTSLCQKMEAPRKAFYRYYESLEDVLTAVIDEALTEAFLRLEVKVDLEGFFAYWKSQKYLLDVLEINGLSPMMMNRLYGRLETRPLKDGISGKELKYAGYISALMSILISWHHAGMLQSEQEMSQLVAEMFNMK
jgi:AcrR family transcriptional regulator